MMTRQEALNTVRELALSPKVYDALATLIPDFEEESEEERLRKGLLHHLKELSEWKVGTMSPIKTPEHYEAWIKYLEGNKEDKPRDEDDDLTLFERKYARSLIAMDVALSKDNETYNKQLKLEAKRLKDAAIEEYKEEPMKLRFTDADGKEHEVKVRLYHGTEPITPKGPITK